LQWKYEEDFMVPEEVYQHMKDKVLELGEEEILWNEKIKEYQDKYPKEYEEFQRSLEGVIPEDLLESDAFYEFEKDDASRGYSGTVLNRLAKEMPHLIGGSADLAPSNKTTIDGRENMRKDHMAGRNIQFGIREHAMAAISNGIALHGGLIPFCATFFVFSDYLKPAIRLSALMNQRVIYIFTHDSIGVGEDGPTHEPIEQLAMMRAMPNTAVYRPADGRETAAAYKFALENTGGPTALVLSRQKLPNLENTQKDISKGAYVYKDFGEHPELILMASGSELYPTIEAAKKIHSKGYDLRVVSVPSLDQLNLQDQSYIDEIFPKNIRKRVSIECLSTFGWHRYTGLEGLNIGMDQFGASGNGDALMKHFGFDKESITKRIVAYLEEE
ncbi:MAG: transketolase C-terminal domain-containing protein, partial [Tissierellia bacterium]|nr:transketolase C-terminal domain-containing protein [Tissierellia bacterium]